MGFRRENTADESRAPRQRGRLVRRLGLAAGAFAAIIGIIVLAIAGYQTLNADEDASVHPLISGGYDDPGGVYDRPLNDASTPTPVPTQAPAVATSAPPPLRDIPYRLIIDKIGVNAAVGTYGLDTQQVPQVPSNGQEVAWYDFSAQPGSGSNAVFAGHVTWSGRGVFYNLDDLVSGDQITLVANDGGARLTYTVTEVFLVDPNDPNSVSVMMPTPGKDQATLITCGGDPFYVGGTAGYDYTQRLIVRASLTDVLAAEPAAVGG